MLRRIPSPEVMNDKARIVVRVFIFLIYEQLSGKSELGVSL